MGDCELYIIIRTIVVIVWEYVITQWEVVHVIHYYFPYLQQFDQHDQ